MTELPENGLNISRPVALWNREIKAEPRKLLVGIGKMLAEGVMQDWSDFSGAALDTLDAAGLAKKPGELDLLPKLHGPLVDWLHGLGAYGVPCPYRGNLPWEPEKTR